MTLPLEHQVVSLDLAKRLKELGVKQDAHFLWLPKIGYADEKLVDDSGTPIYESSVVSVLDDWYVSCDPMAEFREPVYAAHTVAELLQLLPKFMWDDEMENIGVLTILAGDEEGDAQWAVLYESRSEMFVAATPADAVAKMLIYLIENNLISL